MRAQTGSGAVPPKARGRLAGRCLIAILALGDLAAALYLRELWSQRQAGLSEAHRWRHEQRTAPDGPDAHAAVGGATAR